MHDAPPVCHQSQSYAALPLQCHRNRLAACLLLSHLAQGAGQRASMSTAALLSCLCIRHKRIPAAVNAGTVPLSALSSACSAEVGMLADPISKKTLKEKDLLQFRTIHAEQSSPYLQRWTAGRIPVAGHVTLLVTMPWTERLCCAAK